MNPYSASNRAKTLLLKLQSSPFSVLIQLFLFKSFKAPEMKLQVVLMASVANFFEDRSRFSSSYKLLRNQECVGFISASGRQMRQILS
jgi:hypothetical protein